MNMTMPLTQIVLLITICSVEIVTSNSEFFRSDYTFSPDVGVFYKSHVETVPWSSAVQVCAAEGATLATPLSKQEADEISLHISFEAGSGGSWLGLHDQYFEGVFTTLDGKGMSDIFVKWANYEPNNAFGNEDCVVMRLDGEFNDVNCAQKQSFICQKYLNHVKINRNCSTHDKAYFVAKQTSRCYKLHRRAAVWQDAAATCAAEQAELAVPKSAAEVTALVDTMATLPASKMRGNFEKEQFFLGFHNNNSTTFITDKGVPLSQTGYAWSTEPISPESHCGGMRRDGTFATVPCEKKGLFICERPAPKIHSGSLHTTFI